MVSFRCVRFFYSYGLTFDIFYRCEKERASIEKELAHVNELIRRENERKAQKKAREEEENRRKIEARKRLEEEKAEREREGHSLQKPFEVAKSKVSTFLKYVEPMSVYCMKYKWILW